MTTDTSITAPTSQRRSGGVRSLYSRNARSVVARGLLATRSTNWIIILTGVFEPIFYLLALGIGLGSYIDGVTDANGNVVPYAYSAPGVVTSNRSNEAI